MNERREKYGKKELEVNIHVFRLQTRPVFHYSIFGQKRFILYFFVQICHSSWLNNPLWLSCHKRIFCKRKEKWLKCLKFRKSNKSIILLLQMLCLHDLRCILHHPQSFQIWCGGSLWVMESYGRRVLVISDLSSPSSLSRRRNGIVQSVTDWNDTVIAHFLPGMFYFTLDCADLSKKTHLTWPAL